MICEGQIALVKGLDGPYVLPIAVIQVRLDVHAHVLCARDDLAAKVICLHVIWI